MTTETEQIDHAIQLNGDSITVMRATQRKWFVCLVASIGAYAASLGLSAFSTHNVVALFALPLIVLAFQAGRLTGRVETVDRVRTLQRGQD